MKLFFRAWLFVALFLLGCYGLTFPAAWFGDWFASLGFYQAMLVVYLFVITFSAVGYTYVWWAEDHD